MVSYFFDQATCVDGVTKRVHRYDLIDIAADGRFRQNWRNTAEALDDVRAMRCGRLDDECIDTVRRIAIQAQRLNEHPWVALCRRGEAEVAIAIDLHKSNVQHAAIGSITRSPDSDERMAASAISSAARLSRGSSGTGWLSRID